MHEGFRELQMNAVAAAAGVAVCLQAKRILRGEMVLPRVSYEGPAERLAKQGVHDTPVNIRNKIARGKFTAAFMPQVLEALGCKTISFGAD
jgi:hypothetical protein